MTEKRGDVPKVLNLGFGEVVEVSYLEKVLGITRRTAMKYLRALHIKPFYFGGDTYFSLVTFKRILFVLSRPGAPGWIAPGSTARWNTRYRNNPDYITEVNEEILADAAKPETLAEMQLAEGRDPALVRKFVRTGKQKPPQRGGNDGE